MNQNKSKSECKKYIVVDFGASNGKVSIGHFNGNSFNLEIIYRFDNRQVFAAGRYYWDILKLFDELKTGLNLSCRKYSDISSIAVDTWGLDFGIVDKKGKLISNPVTYRDSSKFEWSPENLFKKINKKDFYNLTGYFVFDQAAVFYLSKLVNEKSYEIAYGKKILMMPDLFNYFLCGNYASEYTIACGTLMVNCLSKKWENRIIEGVGISKDLLPKIVSSGTKVGMLLDEISRELQIKSIPVVAPVGHDTASAIAGIPAVFQNKKWAFLSTGTWLVLGIETVKPILDVKSLEYSLMNEGGVLGRSFFARNLTGFWIIQKCLDKWETDIGRKMPWSEIDNIYPDATPFKSFIDTENPLFSQNHDNMPKVIQNYCKKIKMPVPETMADICRCIYESLVMSVKYFFDIIGKFYCEKVELINLMGGGVNNKIFCQWISNVLKIPVFAGPIEATSYGNLLMQLKADGEIRNIQEGRKLSFYSTKLSYYEPENIAIWEEAYGKYLKIFSKPS